MLKKELSLIHVFAIASGAMISSGIFILPGLAYAKAGPGVVISYFLAGLLAITGLLSIAELSTAMPKAGGNYFFITRGMGAAAGTIAGFLSWFSLSLKTGFALIGMASFTALLFNLDVRIISIILTIIFVLLNIFSVKESGRIQVILVISLLIIMVAYIIFAVFKIDINNVTPFAPNGLVSIFSTTGFVFVSYGGLLHISSIAEEVKNPGKNIPLGLILSLVIVMILYTLIVFSTTGILGSALKNSMIPLSEGAFKLIGLKGKIILSVAAILAFISTANAGIMSASRYIFALSRDGLIPKPLAKKTKNNVPFISIMITGLFIILSLFLKLKVLVEAASGVLILTYILSNISVIILRESKLQNYKPPFKAPLYPWIQIVGIIGFIFILFEMGFETIIIGSILIFIGLLVYFIYGRLRTKKEFAILHIIERITNKEITNGLLENELKEIIIERDNIVEDKFDKLINESVIINLKENNSMEELFHNISSDISNKINIPKKKIFKLLKQREEESSTVIHEGVAIPHIILPGKNKFIIVIVKSESGINFNNNKKVFCVFSLLGTKDQRNLHLKSLAAISQIVMQKDFIKKWMKTKNVISIKDFIFLSKRNRG